jgi:hypothetical protein
MTGPSRAEEESALAEELRDARIRGVDYLDLNTRNQSPIETPILDRLSNAYGGQAGGRRVVLIHRLLDETLADWKELGYALEADFVRSLFFAADGNTPGRRTTPRQLLAVARRESGLGDAQFDDRRRAMFRDYAAFLLKHVDDERHVAVDKDTADAHDAGPASFAGESKRRGGRRKSRRLLLGLSLLAIIVGVVIGYVLTRSHGDSEAGAPAGPSRSASVSPPAPAPGQVTIRFNSLGSTESSTINVYPGTGIYPDVRMPNGTFRNGDIVAVTCKTTGRTITSDTTSGETLRQSNQWVRIVGTPGKVQYATLTYADIDPQALASLPECEGVR